MTPKQEAFARAYVETGNASEAYRQAYDAGNMQEQTIWRKAKECMDNGKVTARIEELKAGAQKRHNVTVDSLTDMLNRAMAKAEAEQKGASAMVSAVMGLGKLHGLITEKREVTHKQGVEDLDDGELANIAVAGRGRTSPPPNGSPQSH